MPVHPPARAVARGTPVRQRERVLQHGRIGRRRREAQEPRHVRDARAREGRLVLAARGVTLAVAAQQQQEPHEPVTHGPEALQDHRHKDTPHASRQRAILLLLTCGALLSSHTARCLGALEAIFAVWMTRR